MADKYNFNIDQGATFTTSILYKDSEGAAVNLTGYGARMQIRRNIADTEYVLSLTDSSGLTITANEGKIGILITAAQTTLIPAGGYFYDLEIYAGAVVTRLIEGKALVSAEVTR